MLVRNLTERGGTGKMRSFWEEKIYKVLQQKDEDGLVYAVQEEQQPNAKVRVLHRNNLLSCDEFPGFDHQYNRLPSKSNFKLLKLEHKNLKNSEEQDDGSWLRASKSWRRRGCFSLLHRCLRS